MGDCAEISLGDGWTLRLTAGFQPQPIQGWAEWIEALESGRYRQGPVCLRRGAEDGLLQYCCLGVKHDLEGTKWVLSTDPGQHDDLIWAAHPDGCCSRHHEGQCGLDALGGLPDGACLNHDRHHRVPPCLSILNDYGVSFSAIARVIRRCFREKEAA